MLVSIMRTHLAWSLKKHYFSKWHKYISSYRAKIMAVRDSLGHVLRERLLHRIKPAFKFWRRVARYKQKERTQVAALSFLHYPLYSVALSSHDIASVIQKNCTGMIEQYH
jgi:hypothetical protein